ncbi:MAG: hypothetical protein M1380_03090 [Chloroflexi bacterium]|nr:hypothetical protein [Chloroflexota bacterium]
MDERTVREHLKEVQAELDRNEEEHAVLESLLRGYEGWLRLNAKPVLPSAHQPVLPALEVRHGSTFREARSIRSQVQRVLQEARGEPLHTREILLRLHNMGCDVGGQNPQGMADLQAYSLRKAGVPVEKVGPRTWRWTGQDGSTAGENGQLEGGEQ